MSDIVQKLRGFRHTPRHDGVACSDDPEQLTYLLFPKMAEEHGMDLTKFQPTNAKVAALTPSLIACFFAGRLVPQNPTDEPAEILLEHIKVVS